MMTTTTTTTTKTTTTSPTPGTTTVATPPTPTNTTTRTGGEEEALVASSSSAPSEEGGEGVVQGPPPLPPSSHPTVTTAAAATTTTTTAEEEEGFGEALLLSQQQQQQPPTKKARVVLVESAATATTTVEEPPNEDSDGGDDDDDDDDEPVVDWAERHGMRAGDRLQVLWTIQNHDDDDDDEEGGILVPVPGETSDPNTKPLGETAHWWGATLEPWDGTSEGGSAIRSLDYDPHLPDFPCRSRELVVFTHLPDALLTYPNLEAMHVRREPNGKDYINDDRGDGTPCHGNSENTAVNDAIIDAGTSEPEQLLNAVLEGLLQKHANRWQSLPPAHQAAVAEAVSHQKARLAELLRERQQSKLVVTEDDVKEILAKAAETPVQSQPL